MYNNNRNAQSVYSNHYQTHQHSVSPPPLQHPIPTHPPIQMRDPQTSPSPPAQYMQHGHPNMNNIWPINDATAQIGMEFGKTALSAGHEYVEKNLQINRYISFISFSLGELKFYFKVSNSYVANKIKLLLFPWTHRTWTRLVIREKNGQVEGFTPPRDDINSPDLYIPAMALVTYVLLTGIVAGAQRNEFHPEVLWVNATSAFLLMLLEVFLIKAGCYFLNITSGTPMLDFLAYSGYKLIGIIVTLTFSLVAPFWFVAGTFSYSAIANGFFLLRSLRHVVLTPDSNIPINPLQRKKRIHFLFFVSIMQIFLMYLLL